MVTNRSLENSTANAIELAGGPSAVARHFGVRHSAVAKWRDLGKTPAERVLELSRLTGHEVTPHEIRPDIYPDSDWLPPDARIEPMKEVS